jgi:hypothetical protein
MARVSIPSGWFGDFSDAESTYSKQGLNAGIPDPGWSLKTSGAVDPNLGAVVDPALRSSIWRNPEVLPGRWFAESASGGPSLALQSHYPVLDTGVSGNRVETALWEHDDYARDQYIQEYKQMHEESEDFDQKDAHVLTADDPAWFDNSIQQLDGFGRQRMPTGGTLAGWKEKSVNTTIGCEKPGCLGRATLALFDASNEEARDCNLAIHIHPTDFSSDREKVSFLKVNGKVAMRDCNPQASFGCQPAVKNASMPMPLYSCLQNFPVDKLVDENGALLVEGQITDFVDDCPYDGKLFSGILMATCLVRDWTTTTTTTGPFVSFAELKCKEAGCTAETFLSVLPKGKGNCKMNVTVFQTDYDEDSDGIEVVQFIEVEGKNVSTDVKPAKNPCKMVQAGQNVTQADRKHLALTDYDLTDLITIGQVKVKGKISDQVDECAHDGHMFHANLTVRCERIDSSDSETEDTVAASLLQDMGYQDGRMPAKDQSKKSSQGSITEDGRMPALDQLKKFDVIAAVGQKPAKDQSKTSSEGTITEDGWIPAKVVERNDMERLYIPAKTVDAASLVGTDEWSPAVIHSTV